MANRITRKFIEETRKRFELTYNRVKDVDPELAERIKESNDNWLRVAEIFLTLRG